MNKKIVLCPNPSRDKGLGRAIAARDFLTQHGFEVAISPLPSRRPCEHIPKDLQTHVLHEAVQDADLVVTMGGDGTILKVARWLMEFEVPILGMNLGHKGFLASLQEGDMEGLLAAARGDVEISPRIMLDVELIRDGRVCLTSSVLNDIAVSGIVHAVKLRIKGDDRLITTFSGDGVVIATPTGSTAYSMSAGGPIVEPTAEAILMTPVCPHDLASRCFVLASERSITVNVSMRGSKRAVMAVDGYDPLDLKDGDEVRVRRSAYKTYLAYVGGESFYDRAYNKLIKGN